MKILKDYNNVHMYDITTISGKDYLVKSAKDIASNTIFTRVTNEDLFGILNTFIGQGSRDRMVSKLEQKYCNITKVAII